jgi:type II secretory pathway component PulF
MPLIVTPGQLAQRAEFYQQLASLIAAGVGLPQALEMVWKSPPSRAFKKPLAFILEQLKRGETFSDALFALGNSVFPAFDVALLKAGEQSGRLDASFRLLAEYYQERAGLARHVISQLAYPALILHFAILIFPPGLITRLVWEGEIAPFVWSKIAVLLPLYALILLLIYLGQGQGGERWRSGIERLLRRVPVLGAARRSLALARLTVALEGLLNAGVSIIEAWELAASASGSPALRRAVFAWKPRVEAGQTPAEAVRESRAFPDLFTHLYSTGEISGQLDDTLRRLYRHYQEEASRKLNAVAQWTPRLIYFGVIIMIAYQVVSFWTGYYTQLIDTTF